MKIIDYIKKGGIFETTLRFFEKGDILHVKISKKYLEKDNNIIEILSKTESYFYEDYYICDIKILKNCYFIYSIDAYSAYDSRECDLEYMVENIIEE